MGHLLGGKGNKKRGDALLEGDCMIWQVTITMAKGINADGRWRGHTRLTLHSHAEHIVCCAQHIHLASTEETAHQPGRMSAGVETEPQKHNDTQARVRMDIHSTRIHSSNLHTFDFLAHLHMYIHAPPCPPIRDYLPTPQEHPSSQRPHRPKHWSSPPLFLTSQENIYTYSYTSQQAWLFFINFSFSTFL